MSVTALVAWALAGGAYLEPIQIRVAGDGNRSIFARRDVAEGEVLVDVPRSLVIGAIDIAGVPIAREMQGFAGMLHSRYMPLAAWLAIERRADASPWAPYLGALPASFPPWPTAGLAGLEGTRARELLEARARRLDDDRALLVDLFGDAETPPGADLAWGLRVARSRCFAIEGAHALVPVADMFDHAPAPDAAWTYRAEESRFVVEARRPLAAGDEIFLRYGIHDNAHWLAGYGFVVENNPDDEVTLRLIPEGPPLHVGTHFDARFLRAMDAASDAAEDGSLAAALGVLRAAARRARDGISGEDDGSSDDPTWARTCATIRAGERAVLADIAAFASRATDLLSRSSDERRAIAEGIATDAVGAERLLRGFLLANP